MLWIRSETAARLKVGGRNCSGGGGSGEGRGSSGSGGINGVRWRDVTNAVNTDTNVEQQEVKVIFINEH